MNENNITVLPPARMTAAEQAKLIAELNPDKILADNKEKTKDAIMESMSNERASKEPLPGPTQDFFMTERLAVKTSIGNVIIRPLVVFDITIFKMIDSPLYKILMGDITPDANNNTLFAGEEESYELIYQFTHSPKQCYDLIKKGKDSFKDKVLEEVAFIYTPQDAASLIEIIMSHIFKVQLAKIQFDSVQTEDANNIGGNNDKKKLIPQPNTATTL